MGAASVQEFLKPVWYLWLTSISLMDTMTDALQSDEVKKKKVAL